MIKSKRYRLTKFCRWLSVSLPSAVAVLLLSSVTACSNDEDEQSDTDARVTIQVEEPTVEQLGTRAATVADTKAYDLSIYAFDENGNLLRTATKTVTGDTKPYSITIIVPKGDNRIFYAVANVGGLWTDVTDLASLESKIHTVASVTELNTSVQGLPMTAKSTGLSVRDGQSFDMKMSRLAAKLEISVTGAKDIHNAEQIYIDDIQLFKAPDKYSYVPGTTSNPSDVTYFESFPQVTGTGWTAGGATSTSTTLTDVNYMLASYVGSDAAATTSVLRNSHHPANASYLVVNAHTSLWRNTFTIYLGGKTITSTASASTGDFTDFNIYPNSDYKINITIKGGDLYDARVNYTLLGIYNGDVTLNPSNDENRSIDLE